MITRFANPARFMRISAAILPWCSSGSVAVIAIGLYLALITAPADYQQGEAVRIMFIHVPAAWMSAHMSIRWSRGKRRRAGLAASAGRFAARIGGSDRRRVHRLCLITGSMWGKPMWGTWWVWDARLTSVLVLFFLYLGFIALVNAFDDPPRGARAGVDLGAGRRRQPADHQFLGRLVEHAAPAGERLPVGGPHRPLDAAAAAGMAWGSCSLRDLPYPADGRPAQ